MQPSNSDTLKFQANGKSK
jgi:hypothetical protein